MRSTCSLLNCAGTGQSVTATACTPLTSISSLTLLCSLLLTDERACCDEELAAAAARWAALDAPCCALQPAAEGAATSEAEAAFEAGLSIMAVRQGKE